MRDDDIFEKLKKGRLNPVDAIRLLKGDNEEKRYNKIDLVSIDPTKELEELIGLEEIKDFIRELEAFITIQKKRKEQGLITQPIVLHMIFKGNPGTGKTTVARILGKIFKHLELLDKGHLVEVERADLVGEYIGQTAQKTREKINSAMGGILFIDEAYSLARGGEKDFGKEAIDTLVKAMEDKKEQFVLILAGYGEQMENFLRTNPGLKSRFPIHINFKNYKIADLIEIGKLMLKQRDYKFSKEAELKLKNILERHIQENPINFSNARLVRNIIEKAIRLQAVRLLKEKNITKEKLMVIEKEDITEGGLK
ncbi:stage V sporulation protein K [Anaerobranca californiensis DSM 14826]|jgi:stage V sporulation protein K|uniref:Stage V sporulation protein K n=1 Tax=Anaerobranca californiensis DSM 14826 TaxID=1120989 RepID=A0A1M6K9S5_9FIRM|nr:AAA family ATPase [Anaerobranca californiensis]SHJ55686.1 stage V sporulation protein K [Anaerobranca californiensis DSM 14826]